jgi:hypothetical protein
MSQIRTSRGICQGASCGARDDEGDRALERGVGAVAQAVAAVVGADEHGGARGHAGGVDRGDDLADERVGGRAGLDVGVAAPAVEVAGVVDEVEVDEQELGLVAVDIQAIAAATVSCSSPGLSMWSGTPGSTSAAKPSQSWNTPMRAPGSCSRTTAKKVGVGCESPGMPLVGVDAVLVRAGAGDHRHPVGGAHRRQGVLHDEGVRAGGHHRVEVRGVDHRHVGAAEPVDADDHDVLDVGDAGDLDVGDVAGEDAVAARDAAQSDRGRRAGSRR